MPSIHQGQLVPKLIAVLFGAIVLIPLALFLLRDELAGSPVASLGERAFGNLSIPGVPTLDPGSTLEADEDLGAGGGDIKAEESYPIIAEDSSIYNGDVTAYEYVYPSELPDLSVIDARVFHRVAALSIPDAINEAISKLTLGILPLSSFPNLKLTSFTVSETDDTGYNVSVDPVNNALSINRNSGYWSMYNYEQSTLKAQDVLGDKELIATANAFLNRYNMDRTTFGEPTVDRSWIDLNTWVPDSLSVQYPLVIDGREVYNLWGQPAGMSVTVNMRIREVDGVFAPGPSTFETSEYAITTDLEAVAAVVKRGGLWEYQSPDASKTYTSTLGAPDLVLAEHYLYDDKTGRQDVLYVPALRFPVVEVDETSPYKKPWVIVPLQEEILKSAQAQEPTILLNEETVETK